MKPIRLAVVGAGHLGTFHTRLAAGLDAFDVVAVADPMPAARESVAAEAPGSRAVADYRDLLGEVDAAVVATPTQTHYAVVKEFLEAGAHVLVEKPITPTADQAEQLVDLADRYGLALQVGHVERFNPAMAAAAPTIEGPRLIRASRTGGYTFRSTDIGVVLDLMIHDIDLALGLAGSPVASVQAFGTRVLGQHEDMATAQITFESGCVAQLTASRVSYAAERSMQVLTDKAFTSIDFARRTVTTVRPREDVLRGAFDGDLLSHDEKSRLKQDLFSDLLIKSTVEAPAVNAIEEELKDFARAIETGEPPRASGAAARDAVAVAQTAMDQIGSVLPAAPAPATLPLRRAG